MKSFYRKEGLKMKHKIKLLLIFAFLLNQCIYFDSTPCGKCHKFTDLEIAAIAFIVSQPPKTSNYSCELQADNLCFEFQNYLVKRSEGSFCKAVVGVYSEKTCSVNNRVGSCFFAEASNLKKIYYNTVWTQASSQTDCTNLKGTWAE